MLPTRFFYYICQMNKFNLSYFYTHDKETGKYIPANGFDSFRMRNYQKGDYIALKGDSVHEISIVVEGRITVEFVIDSGLVIRSVTHPAPTIIGAMALLTHESKYVADTIAHDDVTVISYNRQQVERQMQNDLQFMYNFISFIISRVENLSTHIAVLAHKNIKAKVAFYILSQSKNNYFQFDKNLKQLAEYFCVERPSLSRTIAQMTADGYITYKNGKGKICNSIALKELIEE